MTVAPLKMKNTSFNQSSLLVLDEEIPESGDGDGEEEKQNEDDVSLDKLIKEKKAGMKRPPPTAPKETNPKKPAANKK